MFTNWFAEYWTASSFCCAAGWVPGSGWVPSGRRVPVGVKMETETVCGVRVLVPSRPAGQLHQRPGSSRHTIQDGAATGRWHAHARTHSVSDVLCTCLVGAIKYYIIFRRWLYFSISWMKKVEPGIQNKNFAPSLLNLDRNHHGTQTRIPIFVWIWEQMNDLCLGFFFSYAMRWLNHVVACIKKLCAERIKLRLSQQNVCLELCSAPLENSGWMNILVLWAACWIFHRSIWACNWHHQQIRLDLPLIFFPQQFSLQIQNGCKLSTKHSRWWTARMIPLIPFP